MSSILSRLTERIERLLPNAIRRRYAAKFGVALLLVVIVIGLAGAYIHLDTGSAVESQTEDQIRGVAESEASAVAEWTANKKATTSFLAGSLRDRAADGSDQRWIEQKLIELPSDVRSLYYVDRGNGTVVASTSDSATGQPLSAVDAPWTDSTGAIEAGDVNISEPYEANGEPVVSFLAPVGGSDQLVVLTASLTARSHGFGSSFATGDVKVVNGDGTIVLDNRKASLLDQYDASGDASVTAVDDALAGNSGYKSVSARTGMDDGEYAMAYTPVTGTDWVLTYHVPADRAFALQTQVSENIAILVALAIGALFVIGATIGRGTASSLAVVAENAKAIARGEMDEELPQTARIDEMGQLYDAFESMQTYLTTVAGQAEALADQRFDDEILDEDIPGEFGDALDRMQADLETLITDIETAKTEAEAAQQEAESLADSLEATAVEFSDVMNRAAAGDLTQRMDTDGDNEAMVSIAENFNAMLSELQSTVGQIQTFADDVAAVSEEMNASVTEVKRSSEDVSQSIQEIADGSTDQSEQLQEVASEMNDLSATIEEVAATAETVADKSRETASIGNRGQETADSAIREMETIETKMQRTVDAVEALDDRMDRIGEVVGVISDIAEQTNILALNANIEAAHNGGGGSGSGDGFEVVANEVKQLAEETKASAGEIETIIEDVEAQMETTVDDIRDAEQQVQEGTEAVEDTVEAFEQMVENVSETDSGVQEITDATDDQAASTQEVVAMTDTAEAISKETKNESETVAAAAEEQTATLTEVSRGIDDLAETANQLEAELDQFEVESTGDESA
jgi:methyl-accepting chemotaxis protein